MTRYYYYLVLINAYTNLIVLAPVMLLPERYSGMLSAVVLAVIAGSALQYVCTRMLNKFPGKGLPEIIKPHLPAWTQKIIMLIIFPAWYVSGTIMLMAAMYITKMFLNPELNIAVTIGFISACILLVVRYNTLSVLFGLEFIFWIITILLTFVFIKGLMNPDFNWYSALEAGGRWQGVPSLVAFAGASYSFSGYSDMYAYNQEFRQGVRTRYFWLISIINLFVLAMAVLMPIGLLGMDASNDYAYPFITSTDSLQMSMGVVKRVFFICLLLYILLSIVNIIIHWKVSYQLFLGIMKHQFHVKSTKRSEFLLLAVFFAIPVILQYFVKAPDVIRYGQYWLVARIVAEVGLISLIVCMGSIQKRKELSIVEKPTG